tara:strand:+ start:534 stop:1055 length:522 start_codon:yes stop_codon:yes gene_type:complete
MKITVKYNIDFGKALKELKKDKLTRVINLNLGREIASSLAKRTIRNGLIKPKLSDKNPRKIKNKSAKPLFDTGTLAKSLKGTTEGIIGVDYAKEHRKNSGKVNKDGDIIAYPWTKPNGKTVDVPQREFIPHLINGKPAIRGTKKELLAIYKEFKEDFVGVLNRRIRGKKGMLL